MRGRTVLLLAVKELRSLAADPVLVLLILYAFTYAVHAVATGVKFEVENAAVGILDEDRSELSRRLAAALQEPRFRPPVAVTPPAVDAALDSGRLVFVVAVPPRFQADLLAGRRPSLQVEVDATAMSQAGNGVAYLQSILTREVLDFLGRGAAGAASPVDLVVRAKFNPGLASAWFSAVMQVINNLTMLGLVLTGAALIREREHGTIEHLLVMPVLPAEIMLAKVAANGLVIVTAALLSLWLVVHAMLGVPIAGSVPLFLGGAVLYQLCIAALGILLATFTGTMGQFGLLVIPVIIVLHLLSGSTTPLEAMPGWLRSAMQLSPTTHFVGFAQAVLYRAADIGVVWPQLAALAALTAAAFAVSLGRFRTAMAGMR